MKDVEISKLNQNVKEAVREIQNRTIPDITGPI